MASHRKSEFHISWITISYRAVVILALSLLLLVALALSVIFPDAPRMTLNAAAEVLGKMFDGSSGGSKKPTLAGPQQAHFTNIDGTVKVKKSSSNTWAAADYSLPLEKGDVVQTTSEGMAKVVFTDGTSYTIKQDSLIVIEENSANANQQTQVAVQVTTGTVDLTTATYVQGSRSQVIVAGAKASLAPESSAMVHNDARADQHEIMVKKGSGEVTRNNETVRLTDYEKVSFRADAVQMAKTKEIGPPTLIAPANMMPIFTSGAARPVQFSWSPVQNTHGYHVRVSRNPYFSSTVLDRKVQTEEAALSGLGEGAYYWVVQSIDQNGKESVESEKNRFTIIQKTAQNASLALELDPFVQHGHVIEVKGRTEPSARVMVNGQEVPVISGDGKFHYFTPPLPVGESIITVTAQNSRGGVNTQQRKIVIQ